VSSDLVVVGAGIVGASVAYHAARAGAAVTLVDAGRPGRRRDGGLVRLDRSVRRTHRSSRRAAVDRDGRVPPARGRAAGLPVTWSGSLSWGAADRAPEAGPGQEIVDAATAATLEPNCGSPGVGRLGTR